MQELLITALSFAYAGVGIIGVIAYWPTIKDLHFNKKPSANITSYVFWTIGGMITFAYSLFVLQDLLFQLVSGMHFVSCFIILVLSYKLKMGK